MRPYGTGSYPCGPPGRHFIRRLAVSLSPFRNPYRRNAVKPYSEHVGWNRQHEGNSGEMAAR